LATGRGGCCAGRLPTVAKNKAVAAVLRLHALRCDLSFKQDSLKALLSPRLTCRSGPLLSSERSKTRSERTPDELVFGAPAKGFNLAPGDIAVRDPA
jgi:hypothetical protein